MPADKFDLYQTVTDRILFALDQGTVPWKRPWSVEGGIHVNLKSKKAYRGVNQLLLDLAAMAEGYTSPYWVSFKQAQDLGGSVKKGEKSTLITFWKRIEVKDVNAPGGKKKIALLRYYRVFNVAQCEGIEDKVPATVTADGTEFDPIESAEYIVENMPNKPPVSHGGDRACYSPMLDAVTMPHRKQFVGESEYYSTLFHELAHSTGHKSRLDRDLNGTFGSDPYADEELIAEITASFLNAQCGILDDVIENSAAYIEGWRRKLSNDPKLIVKAAGKAQKACDYILDIKWNNSEETESN